MAAQERNGRAAPLARLRDHDESLWHLVHDSAVAEGCDAPSRTSVIQLMAAAILGDYSQDELAQIAAGVEVR